MKVANRYIATRVLKSLIGTFLIIAAIIILIDFVESTREFADESNISALQTLGLTALKTPQLIEQSIPIIVLFGVMAALFGLNKRSELIVFRASGWSAWRFLKPALWITFLLGVFWSTLFNTLAFEAMEKHRSLLAEYSLETRDNKNSQEIWTREGSDKRQTVIRGTVNNTNQAVLLNVTFYQFDAPSLANSEVRNNNFTRRIDALKATLHKDGYWQLENMTENVSGQIVRKSEYASLPTNITQRDIENAFKSVVKPTFWESAAAIQKADQAGFSSVSLRMNWHRLLALPILLTAMTFIAAGVSIHLSRDGRTLQLMVSGAAIGFLVYFLNNIINAFGEAQAIPVSLAVWSVPILTLIFGIVYLAKLEDG